MNATSSSTLPCEPDPEPTEQILNINAKKDSVSLGVKFDENLCFNSHFKNIQRGH